MIKHTEAPNSGIKAALPGWVKGAALFGVLLFGAGTAIFAYAGTYSRYWADDYCYSAVIQQNGLPGGLLEWYKSSGNRFSTLVPVAFSELFGRSAIAFVPAAVLTLWAAAWVFFLRQLSRLLGWHLAWYWTVLLALVEVYFAALLAPDRLQTVYWRMGTFHYTLPIPLLLFTLGLIAGRFRTVAGKESGVAFSLLVGFLAFFAAGLSETFAALQSGFFALALLACGLFLRNGLLGQRVRLLGAALTGSALAMVLMMLSPSNAWRQAALPPPDNFLEVAPYAMRYAVDFIVYTIRGQIVPFLVYLAVLLTLPLLAFRLETAFFSRKALVIGAAISLLVTYLLIVCSFAPSAYAGLQYPAGRALMPGAFILLAGLGCAAFFAAQWIRCAVPVSPSWQIAAAGVLLVAASLYPLRMVKIQRADIAELSTRTARWDARNVEVLSAIQAGRIDVQVQQVDVVQGLVDLDPDPAFWVNRCAAIFYRVDSIQAKP